jgi:hypothetical protein
MVAEICSRWVVGNRLPHSGSHQKATGFKRVARALTRRTR